MTDSATISVKKTVDVRSYVIENGSGLRLFVYIELMTPCVPMQPPSLAW